MPSAALNRVLWICALIALAVLGLQARDRFELLFAGAGTLIVTDQTGSDTVTLFWRGKIEAPMAAKLESAFDQYKSRKRKFVLTLSSPGGSLDQGARVIGLLQRMKGTHALETRVDGRRLCASMCVPVYLQGRTRIAAPNARFMFHEVSFQDAVSREELDVPDWVTGSETGRFFQRFFKPAGVPDAWIRSVIGQVSGGHEVWKTGQELVNENAQIVQRINE